jgi:hypothetical protein
MTDQDNFAKKVIKMRRLSTRLKRILKVSMIMKNGLKI